MTYNQLLMFVYKHQKLNKHTIINVQEWIIIVVIATYQSSSNIIQFSFGTWLFSLSNAILSSAAITLITSLYLFLQPQHLSPVPSNPHYSKVSSNSLPLTFIQITNQGTSWFSQLMLHELYNETILSMKSLQSPPSFQ